MIKTAPQNSIFLITDARGGTVPDRFERDNGVIATETCVVVGCLAEMDGETELIIGQAGDVDPGDQPRFDGMLLTPSGSVAVSTVDWTTLFEERVPTSRTRIRVWTNHPKEPDKVIIGLG